MTGEPTRSRCPVCHLDVRTPDESRLHVDWHLAYIDTHTQAVVQWGPPPRRSDRESWTFRELQLANQLRLRQVEVLERSVGDYAGPELPTDPEEIAEAVVERLERFVRKPSPSRSSRITTARKREPSL